jgi:hypothetical protein
MGRISTTSSGVEARPHLENSKYATTTFVRSSAELRGLILSTWICHSAATRPRDRASLRCGVHHALTKVSCGALARWTKLGGCSSSANLVRDAAICRSPERCARPIFFLTLRIAKSSLAVPRSGPQPAPVGAFALSAQQRSERWLTHSHRRGTRGLRADRYHRLARQYFDLAKEPSSPSLSASYQRTAEDYRVRAQRELRALERQGVSSAQRT